MSQKTSCALCENKDISGIFKCEGCLKTFCLKHTNEHRFYLSDQLNEILFEHENMYDTLNESSQESSILFDQINQWEKESIKKIKQTAQNSRFKILELAELQKEKTKEKFQKLTKELQNAREHNEYLENDLSRWKILLEQFKYDLTFLSPSIALYQDPDKTLIPKLYFSTMDQKSILNESLTSCSEQIQFDEKHHMAMHCGPERTPAYICGTQEYSSGQHQIRLFISKKTNEFVLSFNIMSKLMQTSSPTAQSQFFTFGWQSDDCVNPSQHFLSNEKIFPDLKGNTKFHIILFIDCDGQKISYFNEKTKQMREINVDVQKCPLPWKLQFYLYDVGDTVRLLSSSQIS